MSPAAVPTRATLADAAPVDGVAPGLVVGDPPVVVTVVDCPVDVTVTGEPPPVVVGLLVGPAAVEVVFKHAVEDPGLILNGADCAVAPVLSRRVRPIEVPDWRFATHVMEVLFCWPRFSRAAEPGEAPGRMLR